MPASATARPLVFLLFFLSGVSGLVYEVVWTRYLVLFLGNTAHANAVVLSVFMGGLAVGYRLFGRRADELARGPGAGSRLLGTYARQELAIGLYGLAFPSLAAGAKLAFVALARPLGADSALTLPLSLGIAALLLALPSVLMGGTLPVLVAWATTRREDVGAEVSRLYALNSAGAVAGGLAAGFFLVENLGQQRTVLCAAALNVALGLAGLGLARAAARDRDAAPQQFDDGGGGGFSSSPSRSSGMPLARIAIAAAFGAGFAALLLEVVWIRLFALVFGSATQSFTAVVAAFITGITIGAALARRVLEGDDTDGDVALQQERVLRWLAIAAVGAALFTLAAQPAYSLLPWVLAKLRVYWGARHAFWRFQAAKFYLSFLVMAGPTVLSGLLLPLAAQLVGADSRRHKRGGAGEAAGRAFSANAIGSVLGAALAGTVLVPRLSLRGTLLVGEALYLAVAVLAAGALGRSLSRPRRALIAGLAGAVLAVLAMFAQRWDLRALDAGEFRRVTMPGTFAEWLAEQSRLELTYHQDGAVSTVAVLSLPDGKRFLKVNGKTDASNWADVLTAAASPAIGALTAEDPKHALVIGFGSGASVASLRKFDVDVDVVEIEPAVLAAAPYFKDINDGCLDDPRVHPHLADARTFLQVDARRWDVIVNEPSNPWVAGVSALFSREFLEAARDRLDDGGSLVQWFHVYDMDDDTVRLILRTVATVFPYVSVWHFGTDIALVARKRPTAHDLGRLRARFDSVPVRAYFNKLGVFDLPSLLSLQLASEEGMRRLALDDNLLGPGSGPLHEDDVPRLEYHAPRAQFDRLSSYWLVGHDERRALAVHGARDSDLLLGDFLRPRPPTLGEMIDFTLLQSSEALSPPEFRFLFLDRVLGGCKEEGTLAKLVLNLERSRRYAESEKTLAALELLDPASPRTDFLRVQLRVRRLGKKAPTDQTVRVLLRECLRAPTGNEAWRSGCRGIAERLGIAPD